ncbi:MAG TPA: hypothetical protein VN578_09400 [Candidatus Binatia bacterium]|nr:hypothetical protein [Candidatus Binatia bacterium]
MLRKFRLVVSAAGGNLRHRRPALLLWGGPRRRGDTTRKPARAVPVRAESLSSHPPANAPQRPGDLKLVRHVNGADHIERDRAVGGDTPVPRRRFG